MLSLNSNLPKEFYQPPIKKKIYKVLLCFSVAVTCKQIVRRSLAQWCTLIIAATRESEVGGLHIQGQPEQVSMTLSLDR